MIFIATVSFQLYPHSMVPTKGEARVASALNQNSHFPPPKGYSCGSTLLLSCTAGRWRPRLRMTILAMSYPLPLHPTWQVVLGCDSSLLEAILERLKIALIIPTFQSRSRKESQFAGYGTVQPARQDPSVTSMPSSLFLLWRRRLSASRRVGSWSGRVPALLMSMPSCAAAGNVNRSNDTA